LLSTKVLSPSISMDDNAPNQSTLDPTLSTAALAALESAINAALKYDPGTRSALAKLAGQILAVESTQPPFTIYLQATETETQSLRVFADPDQQCSPTTHLSGPFLAIAALALKDSSTLANSGVTVMGSTALLSDMQTLLKQIDIDWEDALNQLIGDLLGHSLANSIRALAGWTQHRIMSGQRLVSEYLTEELKSLPAKPELESFYQQVDELRMSVDRLEQRIARTIKT